MRILLVEDTPEDTFLLTREIRRCWPEATVLLAQTCAQGVAMLTEPHDPPHIIISDLGLPDSQGLDTVRRLLEVADQIPLVILTGCIDDSLAREAVVLGAQDFIVKGGAHSPRLLNAVENAVTRAQRELEIRRTAMTDPLTRVLNRAGLHSALEARLSGTHAAAFSLLVLDLDRFKPINDTHGHAVGDQLLCLAAQRMLQAIRPQDQLARLGGDEFAVILTTHEGDTHHVAVRLRALLEATFCLGDGIQASIGASIGVAYAVSGDTPETLIKRADAAMLAEKRRRHILQSDDAAHILVDASGQPQAVSLHPGCLGRWTSALALHWITEAAQRGADYRLPALLSLPAEVLLLPELPAQVDAALAARRLSPARLCLVAEDTDALAPHVLQTVLPHWRAVGLQLGLGELGGPRCSLGNLLSLQPQLVTLSASLLQDCQDGIQGSAVLLAHLVKLCQALQLSIVLPPGVQSTVLEQIQRHAQAVAVLSPETAAEAEVHRSYSQGA